MKPSPSPYQATKNQFVFLFFSMVLLSFLLYCSKDKKQEIKQFDMEKIEEIPESEMGYEPYVSEYKHNLNVIYFLPKDVVPLLNYHHRISGIMTFMQHWIAEEMYRYGYGKKTFGLLKSLRDSSRVKIIII